MSNAIIRNGRWERTVTWVKDGIWRTDIWKSVLADPRLTECAYCVGQMTVVIPAQELRRLTFPSRYANRIWGPFNIDPQSGKSTANVSKCGKSRGRRCLDQA